MVFDHDANPPKPLRPCLLILVFGVLLMALIGFGTFFDIATGIGFFFVFVISYFNALIVLFPVIRIGRFGVGMLVYLPAALIGLFMEYWMEMVVNPVLKSFWCVIGFCVFFVLSGLAADLAFRFLPARLSGSWRAALAGVILMLAHFGLMFVGALLFYLPVPAQAAGAPPLAAAAAWGIPWLVVSSGFGGYTAYALSKPR